jgi:hypothetical protein
MTVPSFCVRNKGQVRLIPSKTFLKPAIVFLQSGLVIDIGGTTTDVGILRNGFPREASTEIKIGGVRTNVHMPDVYSIGLGGGSYVKAEMNYGSYSVTVGPRSAGYNIKKEAFIFQDDIDCCQLDLLTATDLAVAAGHATIGNKNNVSTLSGTLVEAGIQKIKSMVELAIDNVKLSAAVPEIWLSAAPTAFATSK